MGNKIPIRQNKKNQNNSMVLTSGGKAMQGGQSRFGLPNQNNSNGRNGPQSFAGIENVGRKNQTQML